MTTTKGKAGVGYVLKRFPVLSETFVLNEILALESAGLPIQIFSLERPNDPRFHANLASLNAPVAYVPEAVQPRRVARYVVKAFKRNKPLWLRTLGDVLRQFKPTLLWRFAQACYVAEEAHRLKIGHLHAHFATRPTTVAQLAAQLTGCEYSFTAHAMDIYKTRLSKKALTSKMNKAESVITVSDYNQELLQRMSPTSAKRIVRIYNGVDTSVFAPSDGIPDSPLRIVSVARLVPKKGIPDLIEACALLKERGVDFTCSVVGKGILRGELSRLISKRGLKGDVSLIGPKTQREVLEVLQASHVYALPCTVGPDGNRDGLPVSIVEALSCGLPVISTPVTGIPEAVIDGYNGIMVEPNAPAKLADALERVAIDRDYYQSLQRNARPSVALRFGMENTSAELVAVLTGAAA